MDYEYKDIVVNIVETKLSLYLALNGLVPGAVIPGRTQVNPTHIAWRALTASGRTPYIKRDLLQGKATYADIKGWERIVSDRGYDVSLIQSHIRRLVP